MKIQTPKKIPVLREFATAIFVAVYKKYEDQVNKKDALNKEINDDVEEFLNLRYSAYTASDKDHINVRIKSYNQMLRTTGSGTAKGEKTFIMLEIFCLYLCDEMTIPDTAASGIEILTHLLLAVKKTGRVSAEIIDAQLELWLIPVVDHLPNYYACYYALFGEPANVALLKISSDWSAAELTFYKPRRAPATGREVDYIDRGTVSFGGITNANMFVSLKNEKTNIVSSLNLVRSYDPENEDAEQWTGYYSSILHKDACTPIAGKLVIERGEETDVERIALAGPIPGRVQTSLQGEELKFETRSDAEALEPFCKTYDGYWFYIHNNVFEIRSAKFEISANRSCSFLTDGRPEQVGVVDIVKGDSLRCSFGKINNKVFLNNMIFDIRRGANTHIDGVYISQRHEKDRIRAGKIRLYPLKQTNDQVKATDLQRIKFSNAESKLKHRGRELLDFFWGKGVDSASMLQPNYSTFFDSFRALKRVSAAVLQKPGVNSERLYALKGHYILYKLDSKKDKINQYPLVIDESGGVSYTLNPYGESEKEDHYYRYEGAINILHDCLILSVTKKNNEPHTAVFIFFVGNNRRIDIEYMAGIYASISSHDLAPVCGRCVLKKSNESIDGLLPVDIRSESYYKIEKKNPGMMKLLTGVENNLIKAVRGINNLKRKLDYGSIFFENSLSPRLPLEEKLAYLKLALEHDFTKVGLIEEELKTGGGLESASQYIQVSLSQKVVNGGSEFMVTIKGEKKNWVFKSRK